MKTRSLAAGLLVAAVAGLGSPAFAQSTSTYPAGSIFMQPQSPAPSAAARPSERSPAEAKVSPLNPLDAPDAGNVWKPSNRDAGNRAVERWKAYDEQRAALRNATK
jgi:hypothetical protein